MITIPRKRFGQHFLQDEMIIHRIIVSLMLKPNEHLLEIGPGQGALTLPILKQVNALDAIELDRDLVPELLARTKHDPRLHIYTADALSFDFASVKQDDRLLRIFGNLPYNISTPLIFHLLSYASVIADMLFMLQKEVAERMAAKPGSKIYGRLSVMVQYHCRVEMLFNVPNAAFYPPPAVQSSVVKLTPYHEDRPYLAKDEVLFAEIVKQAFGKRRKTLRNSLKEMIDDEGWSHLAIHSDLRAENLSVKDFVDITNEVFAKR